MGVFKGVFQTIFGGLGEGVFAFRDGWFGNQEVSSLQSSPIRLMVIKVWIRRNPSLVDATKYGNDQKGRTTKVCRRTHKCGLWCGINDGQERFSKHLALVVDDGSRILFWHDRWIGDASLKILNYLHVQMTRKLAFLMHCVIRRVEMIDFGT